MKVPCTLEAGMIAALILGYCEWYRCCMHDRNRVSCTLPANTTSVVSLTRTSARTHQ